ncbi:MAG: endonuclease/exonuclease/phosphatase family protein [Pseudomonadota bacterium]
MATWGIELTRDGPGLLLRDIASRDDPQVAAALDVIGESAADILFLTRIDTDRGGLTLTALADALAAIGAPYPYRFTWTTNTGLPSDADLNGDGRLGTPGDAQGWGRFRGHGAMALLSRFPLNLETGRDFSNLLWADLPETRVHGDGRVHLLDADALKVQRLSTVGHWMVDVRLPNEARLTLMMYAATPPVFDGPEDRNGRRGADETALWRHVLDGKLGPAPRPPFVLLGRANIDPVDGEGRHGAIRDLLNDPRLQDPAPASAGGRAAADESHGGDPATDTAEWRSAALGGPGNLRVDYVLPSADLTVRDAGVVWPEGPAERERRASRHRLVWVDIALPFGD